MYPAYEWEWVRKLLTAIFFAIFPWCAIYPKPKRVYVYTQMMWYTHNDKDHAIRLVNAIPRSSTWVCVNFSCRTDHQRWSCCSAGFFVYLSSFSFHFTSIQLLACSYFLMYFVCVREWMLSISFLFFLFLWVSLVLFRFENLSIRFVPVIKHTEIHVTWQINFPRAACFHVSTFTTNPPTTTCYDNGNDVVQGRHRRWMCALHSWWEFSW